MADQQPEALRTAVARAIWNLRREQEDRCDMELEDMGTDHSVWAEADAAISVWEAMAAHPPAAPAITDDDIRRIFLASGFTVKDGQTDLKPYVFQAARALLALGGKAAAPALVPLTDEPRPRVMITEDRSYEVRSCQIIAFNQCAGDLDDKLEAAHKVLLTHHGLTVGGGRPA